MNPGILRHRITIQSFNGNLTITGEPDYTTASNWSTHATRYASIEPLTGREQWLAAQVQADITHRIRLRYTAGVTPQMRCVYQGRIFEIISVKSIEERNVEQELMCVERV